MVLRVCKHLNTVQRKKKSSLKDNYRNQSKDAGKTFALQMLSN